MQQALNIVVYRLVKVVVVASSVVAQKKWKRAEEYGKNFQNRLKILNKLDETKYRLVKRKKKSEKWEGLNDLLVIFLCQFS